MAKVSRTMDSVQVSQIFKGPSVGQGGNVPFPFFFYRSECLCLFPFYHDRWLFPIYVKGKGNSIKNMGNGYVSFNYGCHTYFPFHLRNGVREYSQLQCNCIGVVQVSNQRFVCLPKSNE